MAQQTRYSYDLPEIDYHNYGMDSAHDQEFNRLLEISNNLPEGEIVGGMISFPIADGQAWYLVTKARPLTLQHVPFLDAWRAPDYLIRGLRRADIELHLNRARALTALFAKSRQAMKS